jgi:hypothetical protein
MEEGTAFVEIDNQGRMICDGLVCHNLAAWMFQPSGILICQSCYQRAMVDWAIDEVLELVKRYSDGSECWHIFGGVGAFEVLGGYSENFHLLAWMKWDSCGDGYQEFIRCWNARYGEGRG